MRALLRVLCLAGVMLSLLRPGHAEILWGTPTKITGLPAGWHGECRSRPQRYAFCSIWRDGPSKSRFIVAQDWYEMSTAMRLILPHNPPSVLIYMPGMGYVSMDTILTGREVDVIPFSLLDKKELLRFRLEEGDKTRDLTIPVPGYYEAQRTLLHATLALHHQIVREIQQR